MKKNKKEIKRKTTKKDNKDNNLKIVLVSIILIFLLGLIIYARNFRNFANVSLRTNNKDIYNIQDLRVGNIEYLDSEEKVDKEFGKAKKTTKKVKSSYLYKIKEYDGIKVTLKENYNDFVVVGVEVTSRKYTTSRNIKVGNKITKVLKKYRVDNKKGAYMYGNYSLSAISDLSVTKNIYLGYREKTKVEYINRDAIIEKDEPVMLSRITYEYKYGKIKKISWNYDVE